VRHSKESFHCIAWRLFHRPKAATIQIMFPILSQLGSNGFLIGVHVRMGDVHMLQETAKQFGDGARACWIKQRGQKPTDVRMHGMTSVFKTFDAVDHTIEKLNRGCKRGHCQRWDAKDFYCI